MKIFKVNDNKYVMLNDKIKESEHDLDGIIAAMLIEGCNSHEILIGLEALVNDDVANYGIHKRFIYSEKLKQSA